MLVGLPHRGCRIGNHPAAAMVRQPYKHKIKQSFRSSETITGLLDHGLLPRIRIARLLRLGRIAVAVALELAVFLLLDIAVKVFDQKVVVQFPPGGHGVVPRLVGEVGEVGDGFLWVLRV